MGFSEEYIDQNINGIKREVSQNMIIYLDTILKHSVRVGYCAPLPTSYNATIVTFCTRLWIVSTVSEFILAGMYTSGD